MRGIFYALEVVRGLAERRVPSGFGSGLGHGSENPDALASSRGLNRQSPPRAARSFHCNWGITALLIIAITTPAIAMGCGTSDGVCQTSNGFYRMVLPTGTQAPIPAMVFLHGGSSSSASVMKNTGMINGLADHGYALIAPEGQANPPRPRKNWGVHDNRAHPRDDIVFIGEVIADAVARGIDRDRVLLAGFSRGGSMVWDVACRAPDTARAYAAIAGAFWEPLPEGCAGPIDLFHSHGWADKIVPIEGRSFRNGTVVQGDLFAGLKVLRRANGCDPRAPDTRSVDAQQGIWLRQWTACASGRLELVLHPGGHGTPKRWLEQTLDWFEARLAERS